ncbi:MAG: AIR synthase-related protein, partial [Oscillospiraceae bacterium]
GGFYENIPRMLQDGFTAKIKKDAVPVLPIFTLMQKEGKIPERDMFNTFNMGVGMCMVVSPETADKAVSAINATGEEAMILGELVNGDEGVILW